MFYIYKITNLVNGKVYIGKTINSIEKRFQRHIRESLTNLDSPYKIQRAIRKYGPDNFKIEVIDTSDSKIELCSKEKYWIEYYDSLNSGYNMTAGGDGGNTYDEIDTERLDLIKRKIGKANFGINNGQAKGVKCKSIKSNIELKFDTVESCKKYFNMKGKGFIEQRALHNMHYLWRDEWMIAFIDDDYNEELYTKYDSSKRKGVEVKLINLSSNEELIFPSKTKCAKFLKVNKNAIIDGLIINNYRIVISS